MLTALIEPEKMQANKLPPKNAIFRPEKFEGED